MKGNNHMEQQPLGEVNDTELPPENTLTSIDEREESDQIVPRIYVASLYDYNAGILHGTWIEADQDPEDIQEAIDGMLLASPSGHQAEEWAIHDFEGFNGLHLGEWENLTHVSTVAKGIAEHGLAFAHWATLAATDEELDGFDDAYLGHWQSVADYARDVREDRGLFEQVEAHVPENLRPYVTLDVSAYGRDLLLGGDIAAAEGDGGIYVFSNR
jgi:antirestriction protein